MYDCIICGCRLDPFMEDDICMECLLEMSEDDYDDFLNKKDVRENFRRSVFERDRRTCKVCGQTRTEDLLDAHHITDRHEMPNSGYVASNGVTVCKEECHRIVEQFHISGGKDWVYGYHPDNLYKKINSSYEKAFADSELL